jgi:hypothetical protein
MGIEIAIGALGGTERPMDVNAERHFFFLVIPAKAGI